MTKTNIEVGAVCLEFAGTAATWWRMKPSEDQMIKDWRQRPQITILVAGSTDENGYTPASSVNVGGVEALRALRLADDKRFETVPKIAMMHPIQTGGVHHGYFYKCT